MRFWQKSNDFCRDFVESTQFGFPHQAPRAIREVGQPIHTLSRGSWNGIRHDDSPIDEVLPNLLQGRTLGLGGHGVASPS